MSSCSRRQDIGVLVVTLCRSKERATKWLLCECAIITVCCSGDNRGMGKACGSWFRVFTYVGWVFYHLFFTAVYRHYLRLLSSVFRGAKGVFRLSGMSADFMKKKDEVNNEFGET